MYRKPWTNGAKAYPEADTLADVVESMKRKRKSYTILVSHEGVAGMPCAACGYPLDGEYPLNPGEPKMVRDNGRAYCDVNPTRKTAVIRHYYCAWGHTMKMVLDVGRMLNHA